MVARKMMNFYGAFIKLRAVFIFAVCVSMVVLLSSCSDKEDVEEAIKEQFNENYSWMDVNVKYYNSKNKFVVNIVAEDVKWRVDAALEGDAFHKYEWADFINEMILYNERIYKILDNYDCADASLTVEVFNDSYLEETLISFVNGELCYEYFSFSNAKANGRLIG